VEELAEYNEEVVTCGKLMRAAVSGHEEVTEFLKKRHILGF